MQSKDFLKLCEKELIKYFEEHSDKTKKAEISSEDIYIVWCCKSLQNNKALLSTSIPDGMYYEFTFNGDKNELYMDIYKKWENKCIKL